MKYIRTESGYIGTKKDYMKLCGVMKKLVDKYGEEECSKIIKEANTIEELCDLYIVWLKNRELPIMERIKKGITLFPSYFEIGECSFDKGYGAIWTDRGLFYVAKMNDKGELKLL